MRRQLAQRRHRIPMARDLSEIVTILRPRFDAYGNPTGEYETRAAGVPARLISAAGDQIYTEDSLRLESILTFQIRGREVGSTDLLVWQGRRYEIRGIEPLVPRRWLQLRVRVSS